jgi:alkylation response protein AidB-like acyl-CoA dehydrogenase
VKTIAGMHRPSGAGRNAASTWRDARYETADEAWRQEIRDFLHGELPDNLPRQYLADEFSDAVWPFYQAFRRKLAERHWIAPHWPEAYGGLGINQVQYTIFIEEMAYWGAPYPGHLSVNPIGNAILAFGNVQQKQQHLPPIAAAQSWWCQGFSEPNAGSDLGSLSCRGVRDGDEYVITGQKTWTSFAQVADWCEMLLRTDPEAPKHKGITFLLADMRSPGVTVRPLKQISGDEDFNEVFFEDVRVPADRMVGAPGSGWNTAMGIVAHERG